MSQSYGVLGSGKTSDVGGASLPDIFSFERLTDLMTSFLFTSIVSLSFPNMRSGLILLRVGEDILSQFGGMYFKGRLSLDTCLSSHFSMVRSFATIMLTTFLGLITC